MSLLLKIKSRKSESSEINEETKSVALLSVSDKKQEKKEKELEKQKQKEEKKQKKEEQKKEDQRNRPNYEALATYLLMK